MSRSKHKSSTNNGFFCCWACHFSNKKAKRETNQKFRTISKRLLKRILYLNDLDDERNIYKTREVSDVWNFPSDGLAEYIKYSKDWTKEEIERNKRK